MAKKVKNSYTSRERKKQSLGSGLSLAATEAYNLLRTNLSFSFAGKDGCKIIGVTGTCPQEGKSYTSINLSYALAEGGFKVLLIDGDLRRSSIADSLKRPVSPGLSNLLVDNQENVIHNNVMHENLSVLMAGDPPPNPSELIGSARMKSVLDVFSQHFDYIVIDLPPVNVVSDPLAISKFVDGMVVVIRHGKTRKGEAVEAIRRLQFTDVRILGFVYNGFRRVVGAGSYGKYRYSRYAKYTRYSSYDYRSSKSPEN